MGWKQPGQGKVVDPFSERGMPEEVQFVARSVMSMPRGYASPRPPPLYGCVVESPVRPSRRSDHTHSPVPARTDNQRTVPGPAPSRMDADHVTRTNRIHLFCPQHHTHQSRVVSTAGSGNGPSVRIGHQHSLGVDTEHQQLEVANRRVRFEIRNAVCRRRP